MRKKQGLLMLICCAVFVASMAVSFSAFAATRNVPGSYASFFDAITAANTGDTVLAAPGTYTETDISFQGKAITVACDGNPGDCTIDCGPAVGTYAFTFTNGEGPGSLLTGFAIEHADDAGILCNGSSPTITDCLMQYTFDSICGGIESYDSSPTMSGCTIQYNSASWAGGGCFSGGSPIISECVVSDNDGDDVGGMLFENSSPTITDCTFTLNEGTGIGPDPVAGGILCKGGSPVISGSTITYNEGISSGGIHCQDSGASPTITDCTVTNNTGNRGGIGFTDTSGTISDCTLVNNTGDG